MERIPEYVSNPDLPPAYDAAVNLMTYLLIAMRWRQCLWVGWLLAEVRWASFAHEAVRRGEFDHIKAVCSIVARATAPPEKDGVLQRPIVRC